MWPEKEAVKKIKLASVNSISYKDSVFQAKHFVSSLDYLYLLELPDHVFYFKAKNHPQK